MHAGNVRFTPACRQFLCTHRDLRTCYRRAEKRCWVRDSCKPPGCTSPPRLHQPPHACPAQPSIHPSFSRTFPLSLSPSLPPSFHPLLQNPTSLCLPSFATRLLRMDFSYHFSFFFFPGHRSHPSSRRLSRFIPRNEKVNLSPSLDIIKIIIHFITLYNFRIIFLLLFSPQQLTNVQ